MEQWGCNLSIDWAEVEPGDILLKPTDQGYGANQKRKSSEGQLVGDISEINYGRE
jgi:hypothetical protein